MVYMTAGGWPAVSELLFGKTTDCDLSQYAGSITSPGSLEGYYIGCRSERHGVYKVMGLLSMLPATYNGNNEYNVSGMATITQVSDDLAVLTQDGHSYPAYIYKVSDGTTIISLGSQSFAYDRSLKPTVALLGMLVIITIAGAFMLFYKLIGVLTKKNNSYPGSLFVTLSQVFRIACVLPPILLAAKYYEQYGITHTQGYIFFVVEALSFIVFSITLVFSVKGLISKESEGSLKLKYALSILGNLTAIATILLLELLNIWGV
jgi:hypothetical protein